MFLQRDSLKGNLHDVKALVVLVFLVLGSAINFRRCIGLASWIVSVLHLRSANSDARSSTSVDCDEELGLSLRTNQEFDERRQTHAAQMFPIFWCLMSVGVVSMTLNYFDVLPRLSEHSRAALPRDCIAVLLWIVTLGMSGLCRRLAYAVTVYHWFAMAVLLAISILTVYAQDTLLFTSWIYRVFLGCITMDFRATLCSNLIFTFVVIGFIAQRSDDSVTALACVETQHFVFVVLLARMWEASSREEVATLVRCREHRKLWNVHLELLRMVCDVVFELDHEGRLVHDCPGLSNALFLSSGKAARGESLSQFVSDLDKAHVTEQLTDSASGSADSMTAKMFHAVFRDAWGGTVPMQCFHVPYQDASRAKKHLIGIREHHDIVHGENFDVHSRSQEGTSTSADYLKESTAGNSSERRRSSKPKRSGTSSERGSLSVIEDPKNSNSPKELAASAENGGNIMHIQVVAVRDLPITQSSRAFVNRFKSPNNFVELLPETENFVHWLISTADDTWSGRCNPSVHCYGELVVGDEVGSFSILVHFPMPRSGPRSAYAVGLTLKGAGGLAEKREEGEGARSRGTNAVASRHSLSPSSEVSSSFDQSRKRKVFPMNPNLELTSGPAIEVSLAQVLDKWNLPMIRTTCCKFHCAADVAKETLMVLMRERCMPDHAIWPRGSYQCEECGLLATSPKPCNVCRSAVAACNTSSPLSSPAATIFDAAQSPQSLACESL